MANMKNGDRPESKIIGLGQEPTTALVNDVLQCGITNVPVLEYVTMTTTLPLSDTELFSTFGDEIDVLTNPKAVPGIDSVDSSFIINGILQANMLAYGFGVHIFAEPQSFQQIGNVLSPAPGAVTPTIVSPDVWTVNDLQVMGVPAGSTVTPAILQWGYAAWQAAWHLTNAYEFQWKLYQRILLLNEMLADVCYFGPYAEGEGMSDSEADIQEFARQANNRYRQKNGGGIFVPINSRRIGSVNGVGGFRPTGSAGNVGLFHPTRDFDLAGVTFGGIRNQNGAGCCQPFRKFPRPVWLEKGLPIGILLAVKDEYHHAQMLRYMSISGNQGGNLETVLFDQNDSGLSAASGLVQLMPELTLDQGTNAFSAQQVVTSRTIMKGGAFKTSVLIKGVEVWGNAWTETLLRSAASQYITIPGGGAQGVTTGMASLPGR